MMDEIKNLEKKEIKLDEEGNDNFDYFEDLIKNCVDINELKYEQSLRIKKSYNCSILDIPSDLKLSIEINNHVH